MKKYVVWVWDNDYNLRHERRFETKREAIEFAQTIYSHEYKWHWHCELIYSSDGVVVRLSNSRGFIKRVA